MFVFRKVYILENSMFSNVFILYLYGFYVMFLNVYVLYFYVLKCFCF